MLSMTTLLIGVKAAGLLLSAASLITGLTPTPKDDSVVHWLIGLLSFVTPADQASTFKLPLTPPTT